MAMYKVTVRAVDTETVYHVEADDERSAKGYVSEVALGVPIGSLGSRRMSISASPAVEGEPYKLYSINTRTGEITS